MKGSQLLMRSLKERGIKYLFGIFGREAEAILGNEVLGLDFILTRHEFNAGIMAEVYARLTGRPQVCWSTFGPGATNSTTAIASAYLDRSPLIAISAQVERDQITQRNTHQCLNQTRMFQPITKFSHEVKNADEIAETINYAFNLANVELKGPVFVGVPINVLAEESQYKKVNPTIKTKKDKKNNHGVNGLYRLIQKSQNPLILVGNEALRANVNEKLLKFVEKYRIPLLTTSAGKSVIPESHNFSLGTINKYIDGILGYNAIDRLFSDCDLLITLGYDSVEDIKPKIWNIGRKKNVVRISSLENEVERYFKPDLDIVGDLRKILTQLNRYDFKSERKNNFSWFIESKEKVLSQTRELSPERLIAVINKHLDKNSILVSDIGIHKQYATLLAKVYSPKSFLCSNGLGTFGFALPAAMAAKLAYPEKEVIAIAGDGGFHSGSHDLETAARYDLPITLIIVKDGSFGLIKHYQIAGHGEEFSNSVNFGTVDFVKLAEANGCLGYRINSYNKLSALLKEKPAKPRVIEVPILYNYSFGG